jgi:hypothetical protein
MECVPIRVPNAVNIKRFPDNAGVKKVSVSPAVLQNVTEVEIPFFNFTKNETFNNPFTSSELGQIAFDTNNILAANFVKPRPDSITLTFDGETQEL